MSLQNFRTFNNYNELLKAIMAIESDSKKIKLDRTAGSNYAAKDANGKYVLPLTEDLTIDLTNVTENGWASVLWSGSVNPIINLTNNTGGYILSPGDTIVTPGVYKIYFLVAFGKVEMHIPDAESGGTTPPPTGTTAGQLMHAGILITL